MSSGAAARADGATSLIAVMTRRLIFCRTPLQSLLVAAIQRRDRASDTILYIPTSASAKHTIYFDRMSADSKFCVPWRSDWPSHFLTEIRSYLSIPEQVRRGDYDVYLVSSIGTLSLSFLVRKGREIHTYDDGMFNLLEGVVASRIEDEPWHYRLAKLLTGSLTNAQLLDRSSRHYTIFPSELLAPVWKSRVEIGLFGKASELPEPHLGLVTVMLGTFPGGFVHRPGQPALDEYLTIYSQFPADIVLPHPAEHSSPRIGARLRENRPLMDLMDVAIAEEIVVHLRRQGFEVEVYGFSSTTLANVARYARAYNIVIPGFNDFQMTELFEKLGVETLAPSDVLARTNIAGPRQ
jgi:hypothetical protein